MFKSKKAIKTLNRHLAELNEVRSPQEGNTWKASLKDSLNAYLGPDSSISSRLDRLYFTTKSEIATEFGTFDHYKYEDSNKENFRHLIEKAIRHIESNGIYKSQSNSNFLGSFSNKELLSGIVVGVGITFGIGNYLGRFEKERDIIELDKTIESKNKIINELEKEESSELKNCKIEHLPEDIC